MSEDRASELGKKTDETWKERAQREKERLADASTEEERRAPPPASFLTLVEELSFRAMLALGQVRNAATGEVYFDPDEAKYAIDLLAVLQEKTRGNLTASESAGLEEILHGLRMAFVQISRNPPRGTGREAGPGSGPADEAQTDEPASGAQGPRIIF